MDEPTAALTGSEVARLFGVVRTLREQGAAVLFISHRLEEIFELCQRVTTLRDGALDRQRAAGRADRGRPRAPRWSAATSTSSTPSRTPRSAKSPCSVRRLTREGVFTDVSFEVRRGEIVGLAGLVGAGRSEVARAVFGVDRCDARRGRGARHARCKPGAPTAAMAAGLALVPEDRRAQGLVMDMSIERNIGLTGLRRAAPRPGSMNRTRRAQPRRRLGGAAPGQVRAARRRRRHAVRRQPAEGRAGQVAGDRAAGADRRRADARHRRRHQGRGAPAAVLAGRRRASRS